MRPSRRPDAPPPANLTAYWAGRVGYRRAWGWQRTSEGFDERRPQGLRVGWLEGDDLYLEPSASLHVARRMAEGGADTFAITPHALHKAMAEAGALRGRDPKHLAVRRQLGGVQRRVLHVRRAFLAGEEVNAVRAVSGDDMEADGGPVAGPLDEDGGRSGPRDRSAAAEPAGDRGPDGPLGPLPAQEGAPERDFDLSAEGGV